MVAPRSRLIRSILLSNLEQCVALRSFTRMLYVANYWPLLTAFSSNHKNTHWPNSWTSSSSFLSDMPGLVLIDGDIGQAESQHPIVRRKPKLSRRIRFRDS